MSSSATTVSAPVSDKTETTSRPQPTFGQVLQKAGQRALGGGIPGAMAMGIQVGSLMWLRTTMNYQYRYGTSTTTAMKKLYAEGGIPRFYRGITAALIQGPLSRFGDTAANSGVLYALNANPTTEALPIAIKTFFASAAAGGFRIFLMPVDCVKTTLQVEGAQGMNILRTKIANHGPLVLYHGALGAAAATIVGHYPWFFTFNLLDEKIPKQKELLWKLSRNALIGFTASVVSDSVSNSIRVVKTTKQTHKENVSYVWAVRHIIEVDGVQGLFFRGLKTRIIANGFQGMLFTVLWKGIQERLFPN